MTANFAPEDALFLVIGVTGFVGSHVADELLRNGYRIRGAVRSIEKGQKLVDYVTKTYGSDRVEVVVIEDIAKPGVLDDAVKGAFGVVHLGMPVVPPAAATYEATMAPAIDGVLSLLRSAVAHGGSTLKRVVLTSSSAACSDPLTAPGTYHTPADSKVLFKYLDATSWNEDAVACTKVDIESGAGWGRYAASKLESERAAWKFVEEVKPTFTLNTILPVGCLGPALPFVSSWGSTFHWVYGFVSGKSHFTDHIGPQWFVDVRDAAVLHRVALTQAGVKNERIWAASTPTTWNLIIHLVKRFRPDAKCDYLTGEKDQYSHYFVDTRRGRELLVEYGGRSEFRSLEEAVRDCVAQDEIVY